MAFSIVRFSAVVVVIVAGCCGFQWISDPPDDTIKYACVDDELVLPWNYNASPGDDVLSIQWFFEGRSQQLIAMFSHGNFAPMASFANRVQHLSGAGLSLSHVTTGDTGNYSVEISGHDASGTFFAYRHTVMVEITEMNKLMTSDGHLHVKLEPNATYSDSTGQWSLVLSCGNFTYRGDPPFEMEWLTPSSVVPLQSSDGYTDGHFQLHVTSGGDYTCRIPQHAAADACLRNTSSQHATVHVDRMEARMTLMEAEVKQLREENQQLQAKDVSLSQSLQAVIRKVSHQVAFTAYLDTGHTSGGTVIFDHVINNYGNGYSPSTGSFTAPVAGLYFFTLTSSPETNNDNSNALMLNDGSVLCRAASNGAMPGKVASCGAAVHLSVGQRVYVTSGYHLTNFYTSFSGFLVNSD